MTSGELKVLTALDKLGKYVQNGSLPYKCIVVSFYQDQFDNSIVYNVLSNNSGYNVNLDSDVGGRLMVKTNIGEDEYPNTQVLVSPLTYPDAFCGMEVDGVNPYVFFLYSKNINGNIDPKGFGGNGKSRVSLEIRVYPTV